MSSSSEDEPAYVAEAVRAMRGHGSHREFLVKWGGYEEDENTWEPLSGVQHLHIVKEFLRAQSGSGSGERDEKAERKLKEDSARQRRIQREEVERKKEEERRRLRKEEKRKRRSEEAAKAEAKKKVDEVMGLFQCKPKADDAKSLFSPEDKPKTEGAKVTADEVKDKAEEAKDVANVKTEDPKAVQKTDAVVGKTKADDAKATQKTDGVKAKPKAEDSKARNAFFSEDKSKVPALKVKKPLVSDDKPKAQDSDARKMSSLMDKSRTDGVKPKKTTGETDIIVLDDKKDLKPGITLVAKEDPAATKIQVEKEPSTVPPGIKIKFEKGVLVMPPDMKISLKKENTPAGKNSSPGSSEVARAPVFPSSTVQSSPKSDSAPSPPTDLVSEKSVSTRAIREPSRMRCGSEEIPEKDIPAITRHDDQPTTSRGRSQSGSPELDSPRGVRPLSREPSAESRGSSVEIPLRGGYKSTLMLDRDSSDSDSESAKAPLNRSSSSSDDSDDSEDEPEYSVSRVLNVKGKPPFREFFVEWDGYGSDDNTWEPETGVGHLDLVTEFLAAREKHANAGPSTSGHERKRRPHSPSERGSSKFDKFNRDSKPGKATGAGYSNFFNKGRYDSGGGHRSRKEMAGGKGRRFDDDDDDNDAMFRSREEDEREKRLKKFKIPKAAAMLPDSINKALDAAKDIKRKPNPVEEFVARVSEPKPKPEETYAYSDHIKRTLSVSRETDTEEEEIPATDSAIRKVLPREDPKLFKLIMNTGMPPVTNRNLEDCKCLTIIPDFNPAPVVPDRFGALLKRMEFLKISATRKDGEPVPKSAPPPVTKADHVIEKACRAPATATAARHGPRKQEVIHDYGKYFRQEIYPDYERRTRKLAKHSPLTPGTVCFGKEIALMVKSEFRNPDVMTHLGRDIQTYEKNNRQRTQKVMKQVQRPRRD